MTELEELKAKAKKLKESNERVWGGCQDGSKELALHCSGYWGIIDRIKELEEKND